jgi:uncharacterized iron-regulated protein
MNAGSGRIPPTATTNQGISLMRFATFIAFLSALLVLPGLPARAEKTLTLRDLANGQTFTLEDVTAQLTARRIVLVGEHHTDAKHHQAQLAVIRHLVAAGRPVAVGMEMFRSDSQPYLDAWVAGQLDTQEFKHVYDDNWNFPWDLYRPILDFAREHGLPVIGLNVPRGITRRVAREGFDALSPEERGDLPFVTCDVSDDYRDFIRQAYGAHGHGQMNFDHFCEAQLVWDKSMAYNALQFVNDHPGHTIVVLAGAGHVRRGGIPAQLAKMTTLPPLVILPADIQDHDQTPLDHQDADFVFEGF